MAVASLAGYSPQRRFDSKPWISARIEAAALETGPWTQVETYTFTDPDRDPSQPAGRNFTTELVDPATMHYLRLVFLDADGDQDITDPLPLNSTGNLATADQIGTRLGAAYQPLSDADTAQIDLLINLATTSILASLDRDPTTWIPPANAKSILQLMCIEIVARVFVNPSDLQRRRESIGSYMSDEMFAARSSMAPGIAPTQTEELLMRNVVFGSNVASMKIRSAADEYAELVWNQMEIEWALWYGSPDNSQAWK